MLPQSPALGWLVALLAGAPAPQGARPGQCRDPLFATHWSGKNDIQTLADYPVYKTNLKLCPAYNDRVSCCHQTFESEQRKHYGFWERRLQEKLLRVVAHRDSVVVSSGHFNNWTRVAREQYEAALLRYADVLSPSRQTSCFSRLLEYVAGMICFSCKPEWFRYTLLGGNELAVQSVVRLRMVRPVCLQLWTSCELFGRAVTALQAAVRDSAMARAAPLALPDLDMFTGQQQLCDWMHDEVALHPFRLLNKEDQDIPDVSAVPSPADAGPSSGARSQVAGPTAEAAPSVVTPVRRRLELELEFNVLQEGRNSSFNLLWHSPCREPSGARASTLAWLTALAMARLFL